MIHVYKEVDKRRPMAGDLYVVGSEVLRSYSGRREVFPVVKKMLDHEIDELQYLREKLRFEKETAELRKEVARLQDALCESHEEIARLMKERQNERQKSASIQ